MAATSERRIDLDLACGILVIHMIVGHIAQWAWVGYSGNRLLFFFMPWFFYKSGMFFRKNDNWLAHLRKDARRLLVPFVSFSIIGQLFVWIDLVIAGNDHWLHESPVEWLIMSGTIPGNMALWFLLSLFIVKTAYNAIAVRWRSVNDYLLAAVAVCAAFLCHFYDIDNPRYLANCMLGLAFFILGSKLRKLQYGKYIFAAAAVVYAISIVYPSRIDMFQNLLMTGYYFAAVVASLAGIIVINFVSKAVCNKTSICNLMVVRCISQIGRDSMNYYVTHWILLIAVKIIFMDILGYTQGWTYFWIQLAVAVCILPIVSHAINNSRISQKYLFGKNL